MATIDFKNTKAYEKILVFIFKIDEHIKNKIIKKKDHQTRKDDKVLLILQNIKNIIESTELSSVKGRFANPAMAEVLEKIEKITENAYLQNSFGNKIRMDFGTGHELNFLCYLYILNVSNEISFDDIINILTEYFRIIRFFIKKFNVEAAGSRGCWSIDDYLLLPYLFGSSEYCNTHIPIGNIKEGIFKEAAENNRSPMFKNICKLSWEKINLGLLKMYDEEVLGKKVVTQHFIYSDLLPIIDYDNLNIK